MNLIALVKRAPLDQIAKMPPELARGSSAERRSHHRELKRPIAASGASWSQNAARGHTCVEIRVAAGEGYASEGLPRAKLTYMQSSRKVSGPVHSPFPDSGRVLKLTTGTKHQRASNC